ncbi:MAG: SulP family inorganic anion transporter [Brevibacterium sp.]|uniref:SulP family inorganic anion transporter n=1 Tax=Brevibacterium sandarakinum TaxID=629680 RepID=UPI002656F4D9|nr:SulP family inorganic anion transporter [Brevibacterium sandarakinum]MDN5585425.1 SulP family inorganic anion transporter [Brevibacterium sp.]MDN5656599.1 SulP family inorganic anion transporter [Brevibacterium sandarakinum]
MTRLIASIRTVTTLFPSWRDYQQVPKTWRQDLLAGVTVGIVALPLALAFGVTSGAGAESGLITAIIAGIVAAVFGGSNIQVSGPTGAMVVVLGPIVATQGLGVLAVVCVLAGLIVVLAGLLRLGRTITYIPWPVIEGFTLGIATIIFLQQVPAAVGVAAGESSNAFLAAVQSLETVDWLHVWVPVLVVAVVVIVMVVAPRIHHALPGSIIAIVIVTLGAGLTGLPVETIGTLPDTLPAPILPSTDWATLATLVGPAFTIAALAAIESLLSVRVAASISNTGAYDADRELVGQGLASVASGIFGGMPATGAIARTAVNIRAGGRTRLSAVVHSIVLLIVVYVASGVVGSIPLAALSGILMVTATRMFSIATVKTIIGSTKSDAIVFIVTALITVSVDLIYAVGIGIAVAAFFALRSLANSAGVHREEIPHTDEPGDEHIAVFRLDGALFFGVAERLMTRVGKIEDVNVVILRMSQLQILDATGAQVITELMQGLERRGITVLIKGIRPQHLRLATKVGVISSLRHENHLFETLDEAIEHARSHIRRARSGNEPSSQSPTTRY